MSPPKLAMSMRCLIFRSRHLALNSPLGHFNGDNARLSTRHTKLTVTPKFISSNGNMAFAKLRHASRYALFSQLYHISISSPYSQTFLRDLQHKKQTQYSMLQIKTIPKNTFRLSASYFLIPPFISHNLARKQLNVNTPTRYKYFPRSTITTYN